ncbi:hypothetical protein CERSUDRAFT_72606 [Gelatoporia subvermispora B]|uniref:NACHT domain-containing protein n=1 Tax=Ceriporiopsis subvermispora (strain B) TaxID=914234 RepID=M2RGQ7_CERS8|nr:hypothetical protein CERSUDRAFT_72606 [Gelatoporia subvermispora B]
MSQSERMFLEALEKYKQRTKKDLTKEPFIAEFEKCKTAGDVMKILEEPVNEFIDRQEKGKVKGGLMRLLNRMVDVLLALHLNETLGEGIGLVWGPGKAVIGAVVVLLETIRGVRKSYMMHTDILEDVSNFIIRLEVYSKHTISPEMREIMVKILVEVMSILGLAAEQIRYGCFTVAQSHPEKYVKTFLRDSTVEEAFKKLNHLTSVGTGMTSTESLSVLYDLVRGLGLLMQDLQIPITAIRTGLDRLDGSMANIETDVIEMNRNDMVSNCRKWLSPPDPSTDHNAALNLHHEGTATWFTEGEIMREWIIVGSLLWVYGKPGSGKTVLCSMIIDALLCDRLLSNSMVAFFYCDFRDSSKQDISGLLFHLLLDISAQSSDCTKILSDLYSSHGMGSRRPSGHELQKCLEKMLNISTNRPLYIVVDALDECPDSGIKSPRDRMLKLIKDILGLCLSNVHICITSRPEPGIAEALRPLSSQSIAIDKSFEHSADIAKYVKSALDTDAGFSSWSEDDKSLVVETLSEKASGTIRWVVHQLDILRGCPPACIENLSLHLDEAYGNKACCDEWLSPPDPSKNYDLALKFRHEGTATWFTEGEMMQEWKLTRPLLWVHGKRRYPWVDLHLPIALTEILLAGSGKTILCSAIIESLLRDHSPPNSVVTYFYCDFRDLTKQDVDDLLSRLLTDMSAKSIDCAKILYGLYSTHGKGLRRPTTASLKECLRKMLHASRRRLVYIIIDALDECPNTQIESPRNRMLKLIQDILGLCLSNVHICITSRPEPGIAEALRRLNPQSIAVDKSFEHSADIAKYVKSALDTDAGFSSWSEDDKSLVVETLSEKANGIFRWVSCQLHILRDCSPAHIKSALHTLPMTLDETYDRILDGIERNAVEHVLKLFHCLTVCRRPLSIQELAEVLAVDSASDIPKLKVEWRYKDPKATVLDMCSALVVMHPDTNLVQFAHFSVQEYLLSDRLASKSLKKFHIREQNAHVVIAKACLGVLLHWQIPTRAQAEDPITYADTHSPLARYSAEYWTEHASIEGVSGTIQKAMEMFFDPSDRGTHTPPQLQ